MQSEIADPGASSSPSADPRVAKLQEEIASLRAHLGGKDPDAIIQRHIHLLHTYNEIKDGTQKLIYHLSTIRGTTVTEIHRELDLPLVES